MAADGLITSLGSLASGSVDRTTDVLEIVDVSANTSYKITVNNLLGITGGSVVSTSDTQSLTNKTLDNTNAITLKATNWTLQDSSDTTKKLQWSLSGITTGTTRTLTMPDASGTLVLTAATQTLTGKTLTSPTITGGTIDNTAITVDSISGHSSSTVVTIANLQISNGVLNTANSVTATSVAAGAIQPQALVSGTGSGWAWSSWTPSWTNLTVGNGTLAYAKYIQTGKTVHARLHFTLGSTSSISGTIVFSLPVNFNADLADFTYRGSISNVEMRHSGTSVFGLLTFNTASTVGIQPFLASGTATSAQNSSSTQPFTWGTGDVISCAIMYETT